MGKFKDGLNTAGVRLENTVKSPFRAVGEVGNATANLVRQPISGFKNVGEVSIQTLDALVDNFLNCGKVEGKWYEKLVKVPVNVLSACTRRPLMIAGASMASGLNQGIREPFKKLWYTPGKMFKGLRNSLKRIFSKDKNFNFEKYDTHETKKDTWISKIQQKASGFWGVKGSSPEEKKEEKTEEKISEKAPTTPTDTTKNPDIKPDEKKTAVKTTAPTKPGDKPATKPSDKDKEENEAILANDNEAEEIREEEERKENKEQENKEQEKKEKEKDKEKKEKDKEVKEKDKEVKEKEPTSIDDIKKKESEDAKEKDKKEQEEKFPEWNKLNKKKKNKLEKEYNDLLDNNPTEEGIIARGKKAGLGETTEKIVENTKDRTFAGYMEEEILSKTTT